jgi:hypothetical protein
MHKLRNFFPKSASGPEFSQDLAVSPTNKCDHRCEQMTALDIQTVSIINIKYVSTCFINLKLLSKRP